MAFDPAFIFYRDPREIEAWETLDDMTAEADAELADRRRLYPSLVAKGRLAENAAELELRVMSSIADHLGGRKGGSAATWTEQIHCLRREIALRRQLYPRWIETGRIDRDLADRKLRMMESIHDMWWNGTWTPEAIAGRSATARAA